MGKLWNLFEFSTRKNKIYKIKKNYLIIIIYINLINSIENY